MKQTLSDLQATLLLYTTIVPTAILVVPAVASLHSNQDAWISVLISTLAGCLLALFVGTLVKRMPKDSLYDWLEGRLGSKIRLGFALVLATYYISGATFILREFSGIVSSLMLPHTPAPVLMAIILAVAGFSAYAGIVNLARANVLVVSLSLLPYSMGLFMLFGIVRADRILPILKTPPESFAFGSIMPFGWISELSVLLILAPALRNRASARKIALWGTGLAGLHLTVTVVLALLVLGPDLPRQFQYPSFSMIEVMRIGKGMERMDILFASYWICTIYLKMSIFAFGAYHCWMEAFRLKPSRIHLTAVLALIWVSAVFSYQSEFQFEELSSLGSTYELIACNVILPLLAGALLLATRVKGRAGGGGGQT